MTSTIEILLSHERNSNPKPFPPQHISSSSSCGNVVEYPNLLCMSLLFYFPSILRNVSHGNFMRHLFDNGKKHSILKPWHTFNVS